MSKDPLGHVRLAVRDLALSIDFYDKVLTKIGCQRIDEKGWATPEGFGIWLIQAARVEPEYTFEAPGLHHLCFKAKAWWAVDVIFNFLQHFIGQEDFRRKFPCVRTFGPPKTYPQYTKDYYAVFFTDPDGMELEVAFY